ncbi:hypothetical protein QFC19_008602 [Naganishia cerealis]|uniref:Uncharacterized protein n=1 Tax=Naganishia cerealis TaxID=610337 RepID=A0ACC2V0U4_9TREE|nr:hypothetical protein QFC19_008602 [Naganishia cerealis]
MPALRHSITRVYAKNQKDEHQRYKSIYDQNAEEFAMVEQMQRYGVPGDAWDHRPSLDSLAEQERLADTSAFNRPYSYAPPGQHGRMQSSSSLKFSDQVVDTGLSYHAGGRAREEPRANEFASEAEYREYMQHVQDQEREMEYAQQGQGHSYPPQIQTHGQGYEEDQEEYQHDQPQQGQIAPTASSPSHYSSSHNYEHQPHQQIPMPMPMAPPEYSSGYAQAQDGGAVLANGGAARGDGKHGYVAR